MGTALDKEFDNLCEEVYNERINILKGKSVDDLYVFMEQLGDILSYFRTSKFEETVRLTKREFSVLSQLLHTYDSFYEKKV